jgi:integrase
VVLKRQTPKGAVSARDNNNRLQLYWRFQGQRFYLLTGLPFTETNRRAVLSGVAADIQKDIALGIFDTSLNRYKAKLNISGGQQKADLVRLWLKFIDFKTPQCSPNTMCKTYAQFGRYIQKLPTHDLNKATEIRDFTVSNFPLDTSKRFLTRLSACCAFAVKSGLIEANPFEGMAAEIKLPKSQNKLDDINPFTVAERDAIINALASNRCCSEASAYKHHIYAPLIQFLFVTGCRPSEAVALQWKHISEDFKVITFEQALINTACGKKIRQGLKTQERRKFPCNSSFQKLLSSMKLNNTNPDDLVFPSPEGKLIDINNLRNRAWKRVLSELGIEYRKLYQTRHTFITLALMNGMSIKAVARVCGNSPEVILRHYQGVRDVEIPEF